jgi:hypothetical protein
VPAAAISIDRQSSPDRLTDFMATREGLTLAKAFMQISNVQLRRRIVDLVEHGASFYLRNGARYSTTDQFARQRGLKSGEHPRSVRVRPGLYAGRVGGRILGAGDIPFRSLFSGVEDYG